jgi:hypothetical protein
MNHICIVSILLVLGFFLGSGGLAWAERPLTELAIQGDTKQEDSSVKLVYGQNGNLLQYTRDDRGRVTSLKMMGAKTQEISFAYEGESRQPVAAKRGANEWSPIGVSIIEFNELTPIACPSTKKGIEAAKSALAKVEALSEKAPDRQTEDDHLQPLKKLARCDLPSVAKNYIIQGIDDDDFAWSFYYEVQNSWDNYMSGMFNDYKIPDPNERDRCIKSCDDLKDGLDLACGLSSILNPVVGLGCFAVNWGMRGVCRRACG